MYVVCSITQVVMIGGQNKYNTYYPVIRLPTGPGSAGNTSCQSQANRK